MLNTKIGGKNFINFWYITEQLPILLQEKSLPEIIFPNRAFKIRIPDFIDNKNEVKDEDISKKEAQGKEKILCWQTKWCNAMQH